MSSTSAINITEIVRGVFSPHPALPQRGRGTSTGGLDAAVDGHGGHVLWPQVLGPGPEQPVVPALLAHARRPAGRPADGSDGGGRVDRGLQREVTGGRA